MALDRVQLMRPPGSIPGYIGAVKAGSNITIDADGTISSSGGGGGGAIGVPRILDNIASQFNGSKTSFGITVDGTAVTPAGNSGLLIALGGVIQTAGTSFTVQGTTLQFSEAPASGLAFYGVLLAIASSSIPPGAVNPPILLDPLTFNGTTTTFSLRSGGSPVTPVSAAALLIVIGGALQGAGTAYTLNGSNITFNPAPPAGLGFYGLCFQQQ